MSQHFSARRPRAVPAALTAALVGIACTVSLATVASPAGASAPETSTGTLAQDVYVASYQSATTTWFDASEQAWKPLTLPATTTGVVVSPDGTTVYFSSWDARALYTLDVASGDITTLPLGVNAPWTRGTVLAVTQDGSRLFVTGNNGVLSEVDTATLTVTRTLALGSEPGSVAVSPDGSTLYVAGYYSNVLFTIDAAELTLTSTLPVDNDPQALQLTPDGSQLVIGHTVVQSSGNSSVTVVDTATGEVSGRILRATYGSTFGPSGLAITPDGSTAYGVDGDGGFVTVDLAGLGMTRTDIADTSAFATAAAVSISADGSHAATAFFSTGAALVDPATAATTPVPGTYGAVAVAVVPDQAPTAAFTTSVTDGSTAVEFDASASTATVCAVGTYDWDFGDGVRTTTTTPTTTHVYDSSGEVTATLTVTTTCGTSTEVVSTGQSVLRNGAPGARTAQTVTVPQSGSRSTLVIDPIADQTTVLGESGSVPASAHTTSSLDIAYAVEGLPAGLALMSETGVIAGTPTTHGSYPVTVTASTSDGATATTSFTWRVTDPASPSPSPTDTASPTPTDPGDRTAPPGDGETTAPQPTTGPGGGASPASDVASAGGAHTGTGSVDGAQTGLATTGAGLLALVVGAAAAGVAGVGLAVVARKRRTAAAR